MKKIITFFALALIVSSCGTKMTLLKRHYNNGFYVSGSKHGNKTNQFVADKNVRADNMTPTVVSALRGEKIQDPELTASVKPAETKRNEKTTYAAVHKAQPIAKNQKFNKENAGSLKKAYSLKEEAKENKKNTGGGDANLLILIILCFFPFINLISMYLHDGKAITMNFWVCLILDILFFLPGIIFALLVVLDVVNLG